MTSVHEQLAVTCLRAEEINDLVKCDFGSSVFHGLDSSCPLSSELTVLCFTSCKAKSSENTVVMMHVIILTYMPT